MSAWYRVGAITSAGNVVTGTGTKWADNKMGIGAGQMLIVPGDGIIQMYEILFIDSDTRLRLVNTPEDPLSGAYAIISFYTDSVPDFARRLAAQLSYYQSQMDGWQQIMTGTGNVTIIAPDGTQVVMPSFNQMNNNINNKASKGVNGDITELNALTKAITITQGGTGATTATEARAQLGLGTAAVANVVTSKTDQTANRVMTTGSNGVGGVAISSTSANAFLQPMGSLSYVTANNWGGGSPSDSSGSLPAHWNILSMGIGSANLGAGSRKSILAVQAYNLGSGWPQSYVMCSHDGALSAVLLYHSNNTAIDSNGFLKKASPVVKLYGDGRSETNHESEGVICKRISEGVYQISGVLGFNSDESWGGTDGGIEIPLDKNKQALIWVDYKVNADGDLLIKTYHRTHPSSPVFARNIIDGYEDGQPIDIPAGRFVDLRVQMPEVEGDDMSAENVN